MVLALWAAFLIMIVLPIVCLIVMMILGLVLGSAVLFINLVLYFDPSSSTLLGPIKTTITDFGGFIFPLMFSFMEHHQRHFSPEHFNEQRFNQQHFNQRQASPV